MRLLKIIWKAIKDFFSPTKEDWEEFDKKQKTDSGMNFFDGNIDDVDQLP